MNTAFSTLDIFLLSGAATLAALTADAADESDATAHRDDLTVRGVFTSELPDVGRKNSLRLLLHPHFGDLIKYDFFRTDLGLKYSLSHRWELSGASSAYFSHGLGDTAFFDGLGFGEIKLQAKYRLGNNLFPDWDAAIGAGYSFPINDPPVDVTDGLEHLTFFSTFARPLLAQPEMRVFWGWGFDLVRETSTLGRHDKNALRDDHQSFSAGFVLDRGRTHYTFEAKWTTTRLLGGVDQDVFVVRPGIIWEPGRPRDDGRRSRWLVGFGLSTTFGPDGTEFQPGLRIRMDLDFKRLLRGRNLFEKTAGAP